MTEIHVLPVPRGMSAEDAAMETIVLGGLHGFARWKPKFWRMRWAMVRYDPEEQTIEVI